MAKKPFIDAEKLRMERRKESPKERKPESPKEGNKAIPESWRSKKKTYNLPKIIYETLQQEAYNRTTIGNKVNERDIIIELVCDKFNIQKLDG